MNPTASLWLPSRFPNLLSSSTHYKSSAGTPSVHVRPYQAPNGRVFPRGLPQATIGPRPVRRRKNLHRSVGLYFVVLVPFLLVYAVTLLHGDYDTTATNQEVEGSLIERHLLSQGAAGQNCDLATASGVEQWFIVNVRVITELTFAEAKMLDTAWDIIVGQMGRFFHAWILWQFVIPDVLTRILEMSALPYAAIVDLMFSPTTLFGMASTFMAAVRGSKGVNTAILAGLVLLIGHTIAFTSLWSVSTGYVTPSSEMFKLPDGTYVSPTTDSVFVCYSMDPERWKGLSDPTKELRSLNVVKGPTLKALSDSVQAKNLTTELTFQFWDITAYVITQHLIHDSINPNKSASAVQLRDSHPGKVAANASYYNYSAGDMYDWNETETWPQIVEGPQLVGNNASKLHTFLSPLLTAGLKRRPDLEGNFTHHIGHDDLDYKPWTTNYDPAANLSQPSIVALPYNSTLIVTDQNNSSLVHTFPIPAPPLDVNHDCYANDSLLQGSSACLCYEDAPIGYPLIEDSNAACLSTNQYSWGFSSKITGIALILEAAFVLLAWALWYDAQRNSVLVQNRRSGVGHVRNVLDLAARINNDLGFNTEKYSDLQLRKALELCSMVGHEVREKRHGEELQVGILRKRVRHAGQARKEKKQSKSYSRLGNSEGSEEMLPRYTSRPSTPRTAAWGC